MIFIFSSKNISMGFAEKLKKDAAEIVSKAAGLDEKEVLGFLETPPEEIEADLAFPCFVLAKNLKKDPKTIAKELEVRILPKGMVAEIKAEGPYLNFYFDWKKLSDRVLKNVLKERERYGSGKKRKESVLIEHTSANPDGPLHIGHFRNTVIGDSLARIFLFSGYKVKTEFFCNDTGKQIGIAVMEYMRNPEKGKKKPDWWVLDLYVKGNQELEKQTDKQKELEKIMMGFEKGNKSIRKLYRLISNSCLKGQKETLKRIGVHIDEYVHESSFFGKKMDSLIEKIKTLSDSRTEGKRIWLDLRGFGIEREFTLTRSDGTTLYPLRDLAYHLEKLKKADTNLNVIGTDQKFYFRQLISALKLLVPEKVKNYHVIFYEFLLLPEGSMSTRRGKFVSLDELLDKATEEARKIVEKKMPDYSEALKKRISKAVGIGGLKYAMVKVSPEKTYSFGIGDVLKFEGNTAPYIQYTYARASSIMRKSGAKEAGFNGKFLEYPHEIRLVKKIMEFPEVVESACKDFRPHYIANYAYQLATVFNEFYQNIPVLNPVNKDLRNGLGEKGKKKSEQVKKARLALVEAARITIKNALTLLGIDVLEKM